MLGRLRRCGGSDSDAMYARGYQYSNETDPPDLDAARGWYERAANAGHADAMYSLGMLRRSSTQHSTGMSARPTPDTPPP